jgi:hypothetical protein
MKKEEGRRGIIRHTVSQYSRWSALQVVSPPAWRTRRERPARTCVSRQRVCASPQQMAGRPLVVAAAVARPITGVCCARYGSHPQPGDPPQQSTWRSTRVARALHRGQHAQEPKVNVKLSATHKRASMAGIVPEGWLDGSKACRRRVCSHR